MLALLVWLMTHEWSLSLASIVVVSLVGEELIHGQFLGSKLSLVLIELDPFSLFLFLDRDSHDSIYVICVDLDDIRRTYLLLIDLSD